MSSERGGAAASGKRIVVVLGMHRSGTSAIARGLRALGVELGERLMPAAPNNNEKGFFEDIDANALNNELLAHLGHRWDSLGPIARSALLREDLGPFRERAIALLRDKLAGIAVFGMKDPRISRLLPFWQSAFATVGAEAGYVISSRNPLSVADSLARRDGFEAVKSHYLWLEHLAWSMLDTEGSPRLVVDFDALMKDPASQLQRISRALGLPFDPRAPDFAEFSREFLAEELRHSTHEAAEVAGSHGLPRDTTEACDLVDRLARDEARIDSREVHDLFARVVAHLEEAGPALGYMSRRDAEVAQLRGELKTREDLKPVVAEMNATIASLNHALEERDTRVHGLNLVLVEREASLRELNANLAERDERVHGLNLALQERDRSIERLNEALVERGRELTGAEQDLEFQRLRLLESLRATHRETARATRLEGEKRHLEDTLAAREHDVRSRDAIIAGQREQIARLDAVLGQPGHRFVARLGRALEPYPGLRAGLRSILGALQRAAGRKRT